MQSPLQQLLEAVCSRCDPTQLAALQSRQPTAAGIEAVADAVKQDAIRTAICADVLAILLQPSVQGCIPDSGHVDSCKQRGAAAFGRGQYRQAAQLFSEALRYCDECSCPEAAQLAARLYCNRALCLTKLQPPQLDAALQDSSAAIRCDPTWPKGWYRRACAAKALGRPPAAPLQDARRALQLLQEQGAGEASAAEAAALVAELEEAVQQAVQQQDAGGTGTPTSAAAATAAAAAAATAAGGEAEAEAGDGACLNGHAAPDEVAAAAGAPAAAAHSAADTQQLLQQAGGRLAVQQAAGAGRFLVAKEDLPAGSDVLEDLPFAHALTKRGRRSACATCLAPLAPAAAPYYCRRCPMPAYCSTACRDADPFHTPGGPECCRPWSVLLPVEAVAALRCARRLRQAGASSAAARQVATLSTHFAELDPSELAGLAALAAVAHATWQQAVAEATAAAVGGPGPGAVAGGSEVGSDDVTGTAVTAGDVLTALCRLQVNGLAVVPPERHGSEDRLAVALYPVASLLNHSCQPNVSARFEGARLVVRTVEAVPAGEALLHCYGPQAGEMTAAQRQRMLQQQYHFLCRCRACSTSASQPSDVAPAGLRCPAGASSGGSSGGGARCDGAVLPAASVPAGVLHRYALPASSGACCTCGTRLDACQWQEQLLPQLQQAAEAHASAVALLEQQEAQQQPQQLQQPPAAVLQAVRSLRQCLRQRQQLLHPHNLLLGATHDALAHAWHLAGNPEAAAQHLRHSLSVLQHSYPRGSTAAAYQQRQLARMLRLAAAAAAASSAAAAEQLLAEAWRMEEEAGEVLELHFGTAAAAAAGS